MYVTDNYLWQFDINLVGVGGRQPWYASILREKSKCYSTIPETPGPEPDQTRPERRPHLVAPSSEWALMYDVRPGSPQRWSGDVRPVTTYVMAWRGRKTGRPCSTCKRHEAGESAVAERRREARRRRDGAAWPEDWVRAAAARWRGGAGSRRQSGCGGRAIDWGEGRAMRG